MLYSYNGQKKIERVVAYFWVKYSNTSLLEEFEKPLISLLPMAIKLGNCESLLLPWQGVSGNPLSVSREVQLLPLKILHPLMYLLLLLLLSN